MAAFKSSLFGNMPHRNGAYMGANNNGGITDVTPDLHLKMSKKIAQLTKVVYALNTKNDEHDNIVECLREEHEAEVSKLVVDTQAKVSDLQRRLEANERQQVNVEQLRQRLVEEIGRRKEVVEEFDKYKETAKQREENLCAENEQKAQVNVKALLEMKNDFEKKLTSFKKSREVLENDKDIAIQDLVKKHHEELDNLMKAHRLRYDEVVKEKDNIRTELNTKIKELSSLPDISKVDLEKKETEYINKLEKVKTLYEKELSVAKDMLNKTESALKTTQQRESDLRTSWKTQEKHYKDRILVLRKDLDLSKDSVTQLEKQIETFQNDAHSKSSQTLQLQTKLDNALANVTDLTKELRTVKNEVQVAKKRSEGLVDELSKKSASHDKLEATCMNQEQSITTLKLQLNMMREKTEQLQADLKLLENNNQSFVDNSQEKLDELRQTIEKLEKEKADLKFDSMQQLVSTREEASNKEKNLIDDHVHEITALKAQQQQIIEELNRKTEISLTEQKVTLETQALEEKQKLVEEKDGIIRTKEEECNKTKELYDKAKDEIARLSNSIQRSELGLGSASTRLTSLNEKYKIKENEVHKLESDLSTTRDLLESLKKEHEALHRVMETEKQNAQIKLQRDLESQRKELEIEWAERLKLECATLRAVLTKQHEEGQHIALEHLSILKEKEKSEIRQNSQRDINSLQSKITVLEKDLKDSLSRFTLTERSNRESANQQRRKLEEKWAKQALEYSEKLRALEEKHNEEVSLLKLSKESEVKEIETKLKTAHDEDMLSQLKASQLSLEVVKSQAAQKRKEELAEERVAFEREKRILEDELLRRRKEEITKMKKEFEAQLNVLKIDVEKADDLRLKETENHAGQVEELTNTIHQNQLQINELSREVSENKSHVSKLQREIESKGQEILNVRREANNQIRKSEERLAKAHQNEMDSLVAEHLRETQNMVHEFNRAQELMKDKISALQIMLEEAEGRYRNRESRDEDVELIRNLKLALSEREFEMKKIVEEKRHYQLELLNRETNFNKVFKSTPTIGVINPLQHKKKTSKEQAQRKNSGHGNRLEPMHTSNMAVHERKLNQNSPLPPAPPKKLIEPKRTTVY